VTISGKDVVMVKLSIFDRGSKVGIYGLRKILCLNDDEKKLVLNHRFFFCGKVNVEVPDFLADIVIVATQREFFQFVMFCDNNCKGKIEKKDGSVLVVPERVLVSQVSVPVVHAYQIKDSFEKFEALCAPVPDFVVSKSDVLTYSTVESVKEYLKFEGMRNFKDMMNLLIVCPAKKYVFLGDGPGIGALACQQLKREYVSLDNSKVFLQISKELGTKVMEYDYKEDTFFSFCEGEGVLVVLSHVLGFMPGVVASMVKRNINVLVYDLKQDYEGKFNLVQMPGNACVSYSPGVMRGTCVVSHSVIVRPPPIPFKSLTEVTYIRLDALVCVTYVDYLREYHPKMKFAKSVLDSVNVVLEKKNIRLSEKFPKIGTLICTDKIGPIDLETRVFDVVLLDNVDKIIPYANFDLEEFNFSKQGDRKSLRVKQVKNMDFGYMTVGGKQLFKPIISLNKVKFGSIILVRGDVSCLSVFLIDKRVYKEKIYNCFRIYTDCIIEIMNGKGKLICEFKIVK